MQQSNPHWIILACVSWKAHRSARPPAYACGCVVSSFEQAKYGDSFIRGNNILYISTQKRKAKPAGAA